MTCSTEQQFSLQLSPLTSPKVAKKFSITIRNNSIWHTMQSNNFTKEQISNMRSIIRFMTRNKVCHLRKPIHNNKNTIPPLLCSWQSQNKVHRNILPRNTRNRKRHIQTMWIKARLSFLTSSAACHKSLNIATHAWPKEVCSKNILRLLDTKVSHQSSSMRLL